MWLLHKPFLQQVTICHVVSDRLRAFETTSHSRKRQERRDKELLSSLQLYVASCTVLTFLEQASEFWYVDIVCTGVNKGRPVLRVPCAKSVSNMTSTCIMFGARGRK